MRTHYVHESILRILLRLVLGVLLLSGNVHCQVTNASNALTTPKPTPWIGPDVEKYPLFFPFRRYTENDTICEDDDFDCAKGKNVFSLVIFVFVCMCVSLPNYF